MRLGAMVPLALALASLASSARASQCLDPCGEYPWPSRWGCYLSSHGWAFVGQVVHARYICDSIPPSTVKHNGVGVEVSAPQTSLDRCRYVYRFRVKRLWKGDRTVREVEVCSSNEYGLASRFAVGQHCIVFASSKDGVLWTRPCSGSGVLEKSSAVVAEVDSVFREMRKSPPRRRP